MIPRRDGRAEVADLRTALGGVRRVPDAIYTAIAALSVKVSPAYLFVVRSDSTLNSSRTFCLKRRTILIMRV